ncbi:MAG: FtsK/SpoIIIE domain-containing protein, partial [Arthrobacter sp.]
MLFQCTLVDSPGAGLAGRPRELTVEVSVGADGASLQAALAARFGTGALSVAGLDLGSLTIGEPPLVDGAIIVDGGTGPRPVPQRSSGLPSPLALAVHSGAGAGAVVSLRRGQYTIGRSNADILVPDPDLSRQHARLLVSETAVTLEDLGSANGTEIDGVPVRSAVIAAGATIRCGHSTMSLVFPGSPSTNLDEAGASVEEPLLVSGHLDSANRAALVLTAALPLAIGVGLAVVTGMWMFLALTAVSAVSVLVPVLSGRRLRRQLAAAVAAALRQDQDRRRRAAPPLSGLAIAGPLPGATRGQQPTGEPVWLRLGLATQPANIHFDPPGPDLPVPSAGSVPLTLNPANLLTTVSGPSGPLRGLARSFIMQITGYPRAVHTGLLVHGPADGVPLSARFLPGVAVTSVQAEAMALLAAGPVPAHRVLLVVGAPAVPSANTEANADEDTDADADAGIIRAAVANHWQVIHFRSGAGVPRRADIELGDRVAELRGPAGSIRFVPDLVGEDVFDRYCRRLPRTTGSTGNTAPVPARCSLTDLLSPTRQATAARWAAAGPRQGLAVPVGLAADGTRFLDLLSDGPHVLVAGTTGSGKSELLRSLAMALALCHPPDRINLLFVDFKGGSGLGPLTGLPHCVGILTDLASHELQRSLASLRAEIRLREELLAAVQAPDLASYRSSPTEGQPSLPHLVVVIDEFRMLVDEAPAALAELMRIATIGRSLGIHLVMATQRPQGALTADIRANVTTSIALRVQSGMESMDVINSQAAAAIGIDTPGRAFLARGTESPQEFQAASLAGMAPRPSLPGGIRVRLASEWLTTPSHGTAPEPDTADPTPALAAAPLVAMLSGLWSAQGGAPPRRPIAPPLPLVLPVPTGAPPGWAIGLGLVDLPEEQRTAPLVWLPAEHGHLGFIGAPQSGAPDALLLAVGGLVSHAAESHLYILDADSCLAGIKD